MINEQQKQIIINTLMPFNPSKIGIFGSYARNENTETSDIDILYNFGKPFSLFDIIGIKQKLEKSLNKNIDLVDFRAVHPLLKENILAHLQLIYEK